MFENDKEFLELCETSLDSRNVFDGTLMHVRKDTVRLPNGDTSTREYIRHVGAVAIVPVTDDGRVIIERQFRFPLNEVITEIPAGKLDSKVEDHLEAAKRELREETGYTAEEWTDLGPFYPAVGYSDEVITLYLARGLTPGDRSLDDDEFLNVQAVSLVKLVEEVMAGKVPDSKTQAGILRAACMLGIR